MVTKKKEPPLTGMGQFVAKVQADPRLAIQLMLWKARHTNEDMAVVITEDDLDAFNACVDYLEVTPEIRILQPGGVPARPPFKGKDGIERPGRAAVPPRDECLVQLVDKNGNAIKPIERSEEEQAKGRKGTEIRNAKQRAAGLVGEVRNMLAQGSTSSALTEEVCNSLLLLARN